LDFILLNKDNAEAANPEEDRQGEPPQAKNYTVAKGDCLWSISKKQLGNGGRWQEIYNLNQDKVKNPNLIYPGQILTMP